MIRRRQRGFNNLTTVSAPFPSTVTPIVWLDGRYPVYSDAAGNVQVGSGLIRRANDNPSLAGVWLSENDPQRPSRDVGIRCDFLAGSGFGQLLRAASTSVSLTDHTLVCQFVPRIAVPNMGLCATSTTNLGLFTSGNALGFFANGSPSQFSLLPLGLAQKNTVVVRGTPTGTKGSLMTGGLVTSDTVAAVITPGTTGGNGWHLAANFGNMLGFYGSINQFLVINRAVSDAEVLQLLAWGDALGSSDGYATGNSIVNITGDSIATGIVQVAPNAGWPGVMLQNLRAGAFPTVETCNTAVSGSGIAPTTYANIRPYSDSRKNVTILAGGTNDLANGTSTAATLTAAYFAACDDLRSKGQRVVAATLLPRSDGMVVSQSVFDAARATFNANIRNGSSHYNGLADVAQVTGMGADGNSNNATLYSADKVHPIAAGHALLEPTYRAAAISLL